MKITPYCLSLIFSLLFFNSIALADINDGLTAHYPSDGDAQEASANPPPAGATLFIPIEPCRIADSRSAQGPFGDGTVHDFRAWGDGLAAQGGNDDCGIPVWAVAIHVNFTAVNPSGFGFLRAWPFGQDEPLATLMAFTDGPGISNATALTICNSCTSDFSVKIYGAATDLVTEVVGYYRPVGNETVSDPVGDVVAEDLVSATIEIRGGIAYFNIKYAPGSFSQELSIGTIFLDTDLNPNTGRPGWDGSCTVDADFIGVEFFIAATKRFGGAEVFKYTDDSCGFASTVALVPLVALSDGFEFNVPLSTLDDDGHMAFKVVSSHWISDTGASGYYDVMPDIGLSAAINE